MFKYFLFLVIFANSTLIYGFNEPRIRNGSITPSNLFQFAVHLRYGCSGTIISTRHVLTAAHCFDDKKVLKTEHDTYREYSEHSFNVELRSKVDNKTEWLKSTKAFVPKTWPQWSSSDIAIIEFPEETFVEIEPVKLAKDYYENEGDEAYIAGFGAWSEGNKSGGPSDVLRHVKVTLINECFGTLQICAGNKTHQSLSGDSGGPMLINRNDQWYQIGVLAGGSDFDRRTRVSSYCNFIEEVTKNEVKCESIFPENQNNNNQLMPIKQFPPIYKGQETPLELFDFVIPLYNYYYHIGCTGTVISSRHLLTSAWCVYQKSRTKDSQLTEYSSYKSLHGKFYPDFRSKNVQSNIVQPVNAIAYFPSNYKRPWKHNFAVIEFPEGTDFGVEPVTLANDYIKVFFEDLIVAGFGKYEFKKAAHINGTPPALQHSYASFLFDPKTEKKGILQNIYLNQDEGGPTLIEKNGKLYQVYVNYFNGAAGGARVSLSRECNFIEEVTKNEVKCESVAPIYEKPFESTSPFSEQFTLLPQKQGSPNNASRIVFQIKLFLFTIFTVFFL